MMMKCLKSEHENMRSETIRKQTALKRKKKTVEEEDEEEKEKRGGGQNSKNEL